MNIYPVIYQNVEPDALRSSTNTKTITLKTSPGQTNMSHQERVEGWLGTSYGTDAQAAGEIDTDEAGWLDKIEDLCGENGIVFDGEKIEAWFDALDEGDEDSLDLDDRMPDVERGTGWTITVEENEPFQFDLDAGYTALDEFADGYGNESSKFQRSDWEKVLDAAGIAYDVADFDEYGRDGHSSFWAIVVAEDVETRANALMNIYHAIENGDDIESSDISNAEFTAEMFLKAL